MRLWLPGQAYLLKGETEVDFYAGLKSLLHYHREIGLGPVPLTAAVQKFLDARPQIPDLPGTPGIPEENTLSPVGGVGEKPAPAAADVDFTLADIESEVSSCTNCELRKERVYPVAGRGENPVRLMIVGDWLAVSGETSMENLLFGLEQDRMLYRMLAAINLAKDDVFITNVIKCGLHEKRQPKAAHVKACVSHLKRQILVLKPQFICTMGMVAAKAVLERSVSLSRLRGALHDYPLGKSGTSKVLTTYHPSYLLQNPEMKQATWQDLQFLAKKMGIELKS